MATLAKSPSSPSAPAWPPEQGQWTYEDWLRLPDDGFRYEVIDGVLLMAPPPRLDHQDASAELAARMRTYARENELGKVYAAPTGVRLPNQPVPVQPDILFIRQERQAIIGKDYIEGAPDLIVEILSPSNWLYDRKQKFEIYREAGVAEYWIVDHRAQTIEVFFLEDTAYTLVGKYGPGDAVRSTALAGFEVKVDDIFAG